VSLTIPQAGVLLLMPICSNNHQPHTSITSLSESGNSNKQSSNWTRSLTESHFWALVLPKGLGRPRCQPRCVQIRAVVVVVGVVYLQGQVTDLD
jgi:hypothetical protein